MGVPQRKAAAALGGKPCLPGMPDDKIYVIDLKANPAKVINTITTGTQPSGLSIRM
jgi:YVTN family beta-propeller protein